MVERIWHDAEEYVRKSSDGGRLVSGGKNQTDAGTLPTTIERFLARCRKIFGNTQSAAWTNTNRLVPTFVFANERLANPNDDIAETSSVFVEFHKRGMAFLGIVNITCTGCGMWCSWPITGGIHLPFLFVYADKFSSRTSIVPKASSRKFPDRPRD